MSSHPVTQITGQLTRFLFGAVRYTPRDPATVIAVMNLKGGCGKSTIAVNLACELAGNADSVLLLDNDSQGTASQWLAHGHLPVQGEFMPLENDEDGARVVRRSAAPKCLIVPSKIDRRTDTGRQIDEKLRRGSGCLVPARLCAVAARRFSGVHPSVPGLSRLSQEMPRGLVERRNRALEDAPYRDGEGDIPPESRPGCEIRRGVALPGVDCDAATGL